MYTVKCKQKILLESEGLLVEEMNIYHAGKSIVEFPEVRKTKYTKDFSWGFYCTKDYKQAERWAKRGAGTPIVNKYKFQLKAGLSVLKFEEMNDEWLDFIAEYRNGKLHDYDIVEGPMADDTVWNYVNDFLNGTISRKQFWVLAEFKYPTHQISCHTIRALDCLTYEGSDMLND